jgi:hypothetical protein
MAGHIGRFGRHWTKGAMASSLAKRVSCSAQVNNQNKPPASAMVAGSVRIQAMMI